MAEEGSLIIWLVKSSARKGTRGRVDLAFGGVGWGRGGTLFKVSFRGLG